MKIRVQTRERILNNPNVKIVNNVIQLIDNSDQWSGNWRSMGTVQNYLHEYSPIAIVIRADIGGNSGIFKTTIEESYDENFSNN